jgi:hypothetical protein
VRLPALRSAIDTLDLYRRRGLLGLVSVLVLLTAGSAVRASAAGWVVQATSPPAQGGAVLAVSCPSPTACTAVGDQGTSTGTATLAEHWNGSSWAIQTTPNVPSQISNILAGVSCPTTTECIAVGNDAAPYQEFQKPEVQTLAERWDGTSWSIETTPNLVNPLSGWANPDLRAVSCPDASECMAVGYYHNASNTLVALVERWNGTSWGIEDTPDPPGGSNVLYGVSCPSALRCTAVGAFGDELGGTFAERWNGKVWTVQATPRPASTHNRLLAVSCPSVSECTAAGYEFGARPETALVERWNGIGWGVQATPKPAGVGAAGSWLAGVACASVTHCTVVGGTGRTLAELWVGKSWVLQATPSPASGAGLVGVSCPSTSACTAVGASSAGILVEHE